jgi:hypothetical protein
MLMAGSLDALTVTDFESHAGDTFRLLATPEIELKLAQVRRHGQALREGGAFSLFFLAPPGKFLPQAIYPLVHPELGTLEIFIVPIGPMDGGNGYQAVFT